MKVNLEKDSTTADRYIDMVYLWVENIMMEYGIAVEAKAEKATDYFFFKPQGQQIVKEWVYKTHSLTITPFVLGDEEDPIAFGFDVQEDEYLTKFLLTM